jgi:hypothetical protein
VFPQEVPGVRSGGNGRVTGGLAGDLLRGSRMIQEVVELNLGS